MKNLIRLLKYAKPYKALLIISSASLLGITACNLAAPWLLRELTSLLTERTQEASLREIGYIALILTVTYIFRAIFRYFNNYLAHVASWNLVSDMRVVVYEHLQKLSLGYYHDKQTGQLMSLVTNDTAAFENLIAHSIPDLATNVLILLGVSIILFCINPTLAAFTLLPIPILATLSIIFVKKIRPNFREAQGALAELNATLQDNISGIREIQAFNQQEKEGKRIQSKSTGYSRSILHALRLSAFFHPSIETISSLGTAIVVLVGGILALRSVISAADIVGFILYLNLFYQPITTLARVAEDLQQGLAGADRVFAALDTDPDVKDPPSAVELAGGGGEIIFKNVDFQYVPDSMVLEDVSFRVPPGGMVALVGPTGVGKTTVVSLIARFYDPTRGSVYIDGQDIKTVSLSSLRSRISIVLQDIFLFNGTVAENIAYGVADCTSEDIINAAKTAYAHEFISRLPDGYNTVIGERGVKLSGGQKQRLSIARAALRDTPILILDEATSAVDVETEAEIQRAIQELAGTRTIIVIAHRLSTVKKADNIIVISEGRIAQQGTHEELIKIDGLYKEMQKLNNAEGIS